MTRAHFCFERRDRARGFAAPHRTRRMNVELRTAFFERRIDDFGDEDATAAVEVDDLARQQLVPRSIADALCDGSVEDCGARCGQGEAALPAIGRRYTVREPRERRTQVAAIAPEALRTEVVRYAGDCDGLQPLLQQLRLTAECA